MLSTSTTGTQIKFTPVNGNDTMVKNGISKDITTKLMCLTAMQQYQNKSLEELRVEDYQANRKFPSVGSTTSVFGSGTTSAFGATGSSAGFGSTNTSSAFGGGGSLFGNQQATNTGGSLFGNTAQKSSIFGGNSAASPSSGGLFGSTSTSTNQAGSTGLFSNQAKPGNLFGSTNQKPTIFGGNATSLSTGGLFGSTNTATNQQDTTNLFGNQQATNTGGSLFGNTAAKPSLFGGNAASTTPGAGLFGNTATNTNQQPSTGLFGNQQATNTGGSLFGGGQKPSLFGNTATTTPTIGGSLFGGGTAATNQQPSTGLFGNQQATNTTGSFFGSNAQKPSLFGGTSTNVAPIGGGLFGGGAATATQQPSTGLFGGSSFGQQAITQVQQPQPLAAQPPIVLGGDSSEAAIRQAIIESQLTMYPYGDSQLLRSFSLKSNEDVAKEAVKSQMEKERQTENYFASKLGKQDLSKEGDGNSKRYQQSVLSAGRPSVFNYKPLVQRNGFATTELNVSASETNQQTTKGNLSLNDSFKIPRSNLFVPSLNSLSKKRDNPKHLDLSMLSDAVQEDGRSARLSSIRQSESDAHTSSPIPSSQFELEPTRNLNFDLTVNSQICSMSSNRTQDIQLNGTFDKSSHQLSSSGHNNTHDNTHDNTIKHGPVGITLSKRDTYTEPPFEELENFVEDGKVHLQDGFAIGRMGYGRIEWPGPISFCNVDLDELVRFQRKQVVVYPDETKKPPIGEGFNRKAIISLEKIYPHNKQTKEEIHDPLSEEAQVFSQILERKCVKMDCDFLEYDAENGIWMFRVKHFSRYGFFEDEDDDSSLSGVQPSKRHKPDTQPLKVIQENGSEEEPMDVNNATTNALNAKNEERVLGFDETMHDAANFIDPKSLFVSNFDDGKFKRLGIADDIMEFIEPSAFQDVKKDGQIYSVRKRVRTLNNFKLTDKIFLDPSFKDIARLHGHPLSRRIGFGPSENTFVTALLGSQRVSNHVLVSKIKLVPTIEAYLLNYLNLKNRTSDFEQLIQTRVLCMKPPSDFLCLIDAYLFGHLRNTFSLDIINEKMQRFCAAICQDLGDVRFDVLQRLAFAGWLHEELADELDKKLESIKSTPKTSPYSSVFYCLYYGFVEKAADMAAENGLFQLSLFISTYISGRVPRRLAQYAQNMFDSMKQVNSLDLYRHRVYALLAQMLSFSHKGTTNHLMQSVSRVQALAIQLTYFARRKSDLHTNMTDLKVILKASA